MKHSIVDIWRSLFLALSVNFREVQILCELENGANFFFYIPPTSKILGDRFDLGEESAWWNFEEIAAIYFGEWFPFKTIAHGVVDPKKAYELTLKTIKGKGQNKISAELREGLMVVVFNKEVVRLYDNQIYEPVAIPHP